MAHYPLVKKFSYRDQAGHTLETHTEHWRGFTWQAGPVVVKHEGAAWGRLEVWAATAEEGKRVIRHAGEIAGVDPDTQGEWHVHLVQNSRYGRTGTMAPRPLRNGALAITMRSGSDGLPEVAI